MTTAAEPKAQLYCLDALLPAAEAEAAVAHAAAQGGRPRGPVSCFRSLDTALGGALAPGVHVVHGGPGVGKTAFGLQVAATCGFPALFISCEMPPTELVRRITARVTGEFLGRLK